MKNEKEEKNKENDKPDQFLIDSTNLGEDKDSEAWRRRWLLSEKFK